MKKHVYTDMTGSVRFDSDLLTRLGHIIIDKTRNLSNIKGDDVLKNQFVLQFEHGEVFVSYSSIVGVRVYPGQGGYVAVSWKHDRAGSSKTTEKACDTWYKADVKNRAEDIRTGKCLRLIIPDDPEPHYLFETV